MTTEEATFIGILSGATGGLLALLARWLLARSQDLRKESKQLVDATIESIQDIVDDCIEHHKAPTKKPEIDIIILSYRLESVLKKIAALPQNLKCSEELLIDLRRAITRHNFDPDMDECELMPIAERVAEIFQSSDNIQLQLRESFSESYQKSKLEKLLSWS